MAYKLHNPRKLGQCRTKLSFLFAPSRVAWPSNTWKMIGRDMPNTQGVTLIPRRKTNGPTSIQKSFSFDLLTTEKIRANRNGMSPHASVKDLGSRFTRLQSHHGPHAPPSANSATCHRLSGTTSAPRCHYDVILSDSWFVRPVRLTRPRFDPFWISKNRKIIQFSKLKI
jgi:hypothetical protein